jgi:hypothetical protein
LTEDPQLERPQRGARLESELRIESLAHVAENVERLGLASAAIEREHQLAAEAFAEGMLGGQGSQLADELGVSSELEVGVNALLERGQAKLFESCRLDGREGLGRDARKRWSAPEREGVGEHARTLRRLELRGLSDEVLEAVEVELSGIDADRIAGCAACNPVAEYLAQPQDVVLQSGLRQLRAACRPQLVDQAVGRDDLVGVQEQQGQERTLPRAAECQGPPLFEHLDGTEYSELCAYLQRR